MVKTNQIEQSRQERDRCPVPLAIGSSGAANEAGKGLPFGGRNHCGHFDLLVFLVFQALERLVIFLGLGFWLGTDGAVIRGFRGMNEWWLDAVTSGADLRVAARGRDVLIALSLPARYLCSCTAGSACRLPAPALA